MDSGKKSERPAHPRATANPLSAFFFIWVWKIFRRGMRKELELDDLFVPLEEHRSDLLGDSFESSWKKDVAKKKQPSLLRTIVRQFFWEYVLYNIPNIFTELVFRIMQPMFLGQLIRYFEPDSDISPETAYLNAFGLLACSAIFIFVRQSNQMVLMHMGMKLRVGVCSLIYRKSLRLTKTALGETTVGQVVNLLSNDVGRFDLCLISTHFLLLGPIQAVIVTYFMWDAMGIAVIFGILVTLSFIPFQGFFGKKIAALRLRCALRTDERVRLMNEIISAIQVIKLYSWEMLFAKLVARARLTEIKAVRLVSYLRAVMVSFENVNSRLTIFITVLSYVLLGNVLTAEKVFVVSSYFGILSLSMTSFFPQAIYMGAETLVSIKRIEKFLLYEELESLEEMAVQNGKLQQDALTNKSNDTILDTKTAVNNVSQPVVVMTNATAQWTSSSRENTLTNITLKVISAELLAIIGPVGSGKTSLLHALMKELPLTSGSLTVNGKISYASQEPWLFASSVRNNILFGEEYDRKRYHQVVKVCALLRDFELFPYGDKTVVGERGVSLSGGQRARINLARAVYKQADIYILDDPLSAVDAHVGKHLFEMCICEYLRNKTCILVTHQLQFLSHADHIIILQKGSVEAHGTYCQLQESGLDFAKLLDDQEEDMSDEEGVPNEKGEAVRQTVPNSRRRRNTSVGSSSSSIEQTWNEETSQVELRENVVKGKITLATYGSYLFASGKYFMVVVMLLCNVIAAVLSSGTDYWLSFWTNTESLRALEITAGNVSSDDNLFENTSNLNYTTVLDSDSLMSRELCTYIFAGLTVAAIVFLSVKIFLFYYLCMKSSVNLHNRMFNSIIRLPMRFFNINSSGQILNRFSKDTGIIDEQLPLVLMDCLSILFVLLGIVTLVAIVNYWILLPTILVFIVFFVLRNVYVQTSRSVKRLEGVARSPVFAHLTASLQGITTIRAFKAEQILQAEFDGHQDLHSSAYYLFVTSNRAFGLWLDIVCLFYITCVTVSFLVLGQGTLGGSVGLAISQSLGLTGMFQWGMRQSAELENQMTSVERVLEYGSLDDEGPLDSAPEKKPPKEWPSQGRIVFRNVFLSYAAEEPPVLKNLNFTIAPSEKIGIVGRTGAGKSSLISALFRLTHIEGAVLIDDVDTKTLGLHDLRNKISIIPQEPILFSGSLRKNLDPFDEYSDAAVWSALEEVELKEAVEELPAGLNHRMSEGGTNFSLGQRQLVCLARAVIKNSKVLIMDEATANVDPQTDALIQDTVCRKFADCTVLTIAHRLLTVMDSNKILVMDAGNVVEFDHPHLLLQNKNGFLRSMVEETGKSMAETLVNMAEKNYQDAEHKKTN